MTPSSLGLPGGANGKLRRTRAWRPEEVPRTILTPFHSILEPNYRKARPRDRVYSYMA